MGQMILEAFFGGRKRPDVAPRLVISVNGYDTHLPVAFR
jgi:hypothetical protein